MDRDLRLLDRELRARHPDPFHHVSADEWEQALSAPVDEPFVVRLMRLVALLGPRDGHSALWPRDEGHRRALHRLPERLFVFDDGVFVAGGSQVTAIGGVAIAELLRRVAPLVAADNDWSRAARLPEWLTCVEVLAAAGAEGTELELEHRALPLRRPRVKPAGYVEYAATDVRTAQSVAAQLRGASGRVLVDVRANAGGDNRTYGPVLDAVRDAAADVFVLVGRGTFSAAANFAAEAARLPRVTLVGEPTGGAPNQYGDPVPVELPESGWKVWIATRFHEIVRPDDGRDTTEPHVRVPVLSSDHFAGRDAAVEQILAS
jgi:hypothetical protein